MLEQYRREYTDFHMSVMREYYLFFSGQKTSLEIAPIFDRYGDLFSADMIAKLKQGLSDTPEHFETERASFRHLLSFAVEHYLENSAKELTKAISEQEARTKVEWMGRKMTFQDSSVAIATERDRDTRRAIYKERIQVVESSNDLRANRLTRLHETARALGHDNYRTLYEEMRGLDFSRFEREAERLISSTEPVYIARLDEGLKRDLRIRIEEAERFDAVYFLHLSHYDERFPTSTLLRVYDNTLAGLGISVTAQKNILIDSEARPLKSSRAFCMAISVPEEVRLVIRPVGGQSDYQSLLHEGGHAQHYGWASSSLRPEFKYSGDYALTETYAFLLNHLVTDSAWLEQFLSFRDNKDFIRSAMLARLVIIRRYAAKFMYECELHKAENILATADLYAEFQTDATKFATGPAEFLLDLDDGFYSASYLRAWAFEVMLREHLKGRFGQKWWASHRAGNFLKEMWETGDRYSADEMAAQIGIGPIIFEPLIDEFNQALK